MAKPKDKQQGGMIKGLIQFYENDGDATIFLGDLIIGTIKRRYCRITKRKLNNLCKLLNIKIIKWEKCSWGWQSKIEIKS